MTEVYEVATFYHHFDVVKEGETPPPAVDGARLRDAFVPDGGIGGAPCRGSQRLRVRRAGHRRAVHRALRAGARRRGRPQSRSTRDRRTPSWRPIAGKHTEPAGACVYRLSGVSRRPAVTAVCLPACAASARSRTCIKTMEDSSLARPGRRRVPGRPQVEDRARRAGAAAHGRQHRRRRARHLQGSLLPGTRSASLPRGHADRGVGGRHRRRLRLSARRICGVPRDPQPRDRRARGRSAVRAARAFTCAAAPARTSAAKSRR